MTLHPYPDLVELRQAARDLNAGLDGLLRLAAKYPTEDVQEITDALHEPVNDAQGLLDEWEEDQRMSEQDADE